MLGHAPRQTRFVRSAVEMEEFDDEFYSSIFAGEIDLDDEAMDDEIDPALWADIVPSDDEPDVPAVATDGHKSDPAHPVLFGQMSPEQRLQKHLEEHPKARKKHIKKEKELRDIILRAAESGYVDIMRQALPMLNKVQKRLKQNPESKSVLNFCEGKREGSLQRNKQVCCSPQKPCVGL